jgi:phosphoenolpyruvate synthase/pyruvate phosphate dikinase
VVNIGSRTVRRERSQCQPSTAREYGIPAVVGCADATPRLRDGRRVTVDGGAGNVEPDSGALPD